jgi:hypothetical protein
LGATAAISPSPDESPDTTRSLAQRSSTWRMSPAISDRAVPLRARAVSPTVST